MTELLGPQPSWIDSHNGCTYNPNPPQSPDGDCRQPATLHIRLRGNKGMAAACTKHARTALLNLPIEDWHPWLTWCNMPGTYWHPSPTPDETYSYCSLDALPPEELATLGMNSGLHCGGCDH